MIGNPIRQYSEIRKIVAKKRKLKGYVALDNKHNKLYWDIVLWWAIPITALVWILSFVWIWSMW